MLSEHPKDCFVLGEKVITIAGEEAIATIRARPKTRNDVATIPPTDE